MGWDGQTVVSRPNSPNQKVVQQTLWRWYCITICACFFVSALFAATNCPINLRQIVLRRCGCYVGWKSHKQIPFDKPRQHTAEEVVYKPLEFHLSCSVDEVQHLPPLVALFCFHSFAATSFSCLSKKVYNHVRLITRYWALEFVESLTQYKVGKQSIKASKPKLQ